jgi:tetratricopeptide (TPR) repeat protein
MNRIELIDLANRIISQPHTDSEKLEEAEKLLLDYLNSHENDILVWYKLAILELIPPLVDDRSAVSYLEIIWEKTRDIKSIIYIAVIQDIHAVITDRIVDILQKYHTENKEILSMVYYCLGLYYMNKENFTYSNNYFLKAVTLYPNFVHAYKQLGMIHKKTDIVMSRYYYQQAVEKVQIIYDESDKENTDHLSVEDFEYETILGIAATKYKYHYLVELSNS